MIKTEFQDEPFTKKLDLGTFSLYKLKNGKNRIFVKPESTNIKNFEEFKKSHKILLNTFFDE